MFLLDRGFRPTTPCFLSAGVTLKAAQSYQWDSPVSYARSMDCAKAVEVLNQACTNISSDQLKANTEALQANHEAYLARVAQTEQERERLSKLSNPFATTQSSGYTTSSAQSSASRSPSHPQRCSNCSGSGKVSNWCTSCHGSGQVQSLHSRARI